MFCVRLLCTITKIPTLYLNASNRGICLEVTSTKLYPTLEIHMFVLFVSIALQLLCGNCNGNDFRGHGPVSWTTPLSTAQFRAHRLPEIAVPGDPFVSLEHINIAVKKTDWNESFEKFWVKGLGLVHDPRAASVLNVTSSAGGNAIGLEWFNIGLQQFHLPLTPHAPDEIVRGTIGLLYSSSDESALKSRLHNAGIEFIEIADISNSSKDSIGFSQQEQNGVNKAMWRFSPKEKSHEIGPAASLRLTCPNGNKILVHFADEQSPEHTLFGPAPYLCKVDDNSTAVNEESNGESFQDSDSCVRNSTKGGNDPYHVTSGLPGGKSLGLGLPYVQFDVPMGSALKIKRFYEHYFGAHTQVRPVFHTSHNQIGVVEQTIERDGSGDGEVESLPQDPSVMDNDLSTSGLLEARIAIGFHQYLLFRETNDSSLLVPYDGHHIALYSNRFVPHYHTLKRAKLIWNNPKFPQFKYDSLDLVLKHNEYRIRHIIDVDSGSLVFELEHEIRSLLHPGFSCKDWIIKA